MWHDSMRQRRISKRQIAPETYLLPTYLIRLSPLLVIHIFFPPSCSPEGAEQNILQPLANAAGTNSVLHPHKENWEDITLRSSPAHMRDNTAQHTEGLRTYTTNWSPVPITFRYQTLIGSTAFHRRIHVSLMNSSSPYPYTSKHQFYQIASGTVHNPETQQATTFRT